MWAVLQHGSGRIDVEDLTALCERSRAAARAGTAPQYWIVAVKAWREEAWALAREMRRKTGNDEQEGTEKTEKRI